MSKNDYRRRRMRRKSQQFTHRLPFFFLGIILVGCVGTGIFYVGNQLKKRSTTPADSTTAQIQSIDKATVTLSSGSALSDASSVQESVSSEASLPDDVSTLLSQAQALAIGYDYDGAISLLNQNPDLASDSAVQEAIAGYENTKTTLVKTDVTKVTHVFFHTLIMDTAKAFDGDYKQNGYNQMMTTKSEFEKIMQSMYDRGFVLVSLHDLSYEVTETDGSKRFVTGEIMLPPGKQAFVLSQDDVCYYEYMDGDGFASRIVVGEDGYPTCEMKMDDGSTAVGDYDLVPLLEKFVREHPDFSYKGARGVLAFTGYNGILGYRTAASYSSSPTYEADRAAASQVAQVLRDKGWELASHSWGHRNMGTIPYEEFKSDTDKWKAEVESLIGPTDIILFPFGSDIGGWMPYTNDNERFNYLKQAGFRYFCNVDSSKYWVQVGQDHFRQGRRNLDGYRMYYDMAEEGIDRLGDLMNVSEVFDPSRPTPVPPMGS